VATEKGHTAVVQELVNTAKIDRCGGPTGGELALHLAAQGGYIPIMDTLINAGVKDVDSEVLCAAVSYGGQHALQFLLQRPEIFKTSCTCGTTYVNHLCKSDGMTPLLCCITQDNPTMVATRVVRMLIDAGADTTTVFYDRDTEKSVGCTAREIIDAKICQRYSLFGFGDHSDTMRALQGVHRLLMQEEAIHAVSWGWADYTKGHRSPAKKSPTLLPLTRRESRVTKSRVVLRALFRRVFLLHFSTLFLLQIQWYVRTLIELPCPARRIRRYTNAKRDVQPDAKEGST